MGYLAHMLVALFAQGLHEVGLTLEWRAPLAVAALAVVPVVLARQARKDSLAGRFRRGELLFTLQHACPPALFLVASTCLGWQRSLASWLGRDHELFDWPHPSIALSFLPFLAYGLVAIDARARALDTRGDEVRRSRRFHVRMFLSSFVPIAGYVLLASAVAANETLRVRIEYVGLYAAGFGVFLVVVLLALLPSVLARTFETEPLQRAPLRDLLDALARRAGFRCREILLWRTGNRVANAAVVGALPRLRVVLLSDALLSQLSLRETLAVFAHEVGHARRQHVAIFLSWTVGFFLALDFVVTASGLQDEFMGFGVLALGLVLWYLGFGWLSRRFELDADLYSLELLEDPESMIGALERVGGAHGRARRSWRHFSTGRRVEFLRAMASEPAVGRRLRKQLRAMTWLGGCLLVAASALQLVQLGAALPRDRVVSELALGRYEAADLGLERLESADEELARRVGRALKLARALGSGRPGPDDLERAALAALEAGDELAASDLIDLALLRGEETLAEAGRALAQVAQGGEVSAERWRALGRQLEDARPAWARVLEGRAGTQ